jgi:hypothetical protein
VPSLFFACKTVPLTYVPVDDVNVAASLGIINIEEFERIAFKTKSKTVYYTDAYFFIITDGLTYSHISRGYKSIREYKEGKLSEPDEWSIFKPGYSN